MKEKNAEYVWIAEDLLVVVVVVVVFVLLGGVAVELETGRVDDVIVALLRGCAGVVVL